MTTCDGRACPGHRVFDDAPISRGNSEFETSKSFTLQLQEVVENDERDVSKILANLGLTGSAISTMWLHRNVDARMARRYVIRGDTRIIGYLTWSAKNTASFVSARAAVDESHALAFDAARILVRYLLDQLAGIGPLQVGFITAPRQSYLREIATGAGFSENLGISQNGGANFNEDSKRILDKCRPGTTIVIDEIRAIGPGGDTRQLPPIAFNLF